MKKDDKQASTLFDYTSEDIRKGQVIPAPRSIKTEKKRRAISGRAIYILAVVLVSVILAAVFISSALRNASERLVLEIEAGEIVPSAMADGSYSGQYTAAGMGAAVNVTITEGTITGLALTAFSGIDTARAQAVFDAVIASQSLHVAEPGIGTQATDVILLKAIEAAFDTTETLAV